MGSDTPETPRVRYPPAIDPSRVGEYDALAGCGGGLFFDEVLEYRVWIHPTSPEEADEDGSLNDYYHAFPTFEEALAFSRKTEGAEEPLVLVRQYEWINEPVPEQYEHKRENRQAEWKVEWLSRGPRKKGQIEAFLLRQITWDDLRSPEFGEKWEHGWYGRG